MAHISVAAAGEQPTSLQRLAAADAAADARGAAWRPVFVYPSCPPSSSADINYTYLPGPLFTCVRRMRSDGLSHPQTHNRPIQFTRRICKSPHTTYTPCLKKNIPDVFSYNSRKHWRIFIIFGRNVTEKASNHMLLHFPTSPN